MSIYDETKSLPKFSFDYSKLKFPVLAVIIVLVIVFLIVSASSLFKPDPLFVSFEDPTFDLSEKNSLLMKIVVSNVLEEDAVDSTLKVDPIDADSIIISPEEVSIPVLGKGESRTFNFNLRALNENIASGNYEIQVGFVSGGRLFLKRTSIYIKND
ncbi:MAG: hypothetical protein COT90_00415 [Candidatus Diapherotrites archaeon CG10_big_fil_rev_8_21_14_0_10_31_34]|nr:MAG: hypothetical protein COT90_00415 [Candidatus Diapherotrites archaeon CG10_big_fil_rev_8_21_14_0_10_31_34]